MVKYVIFGAGRVGGNMAAYLAHLGHEVRLISHRAARDSREQTKDEIEAAHIIAAAIPDDRLEAWLENWGPLIGERIAIHFSGAATVNGMHAYHPLYSFPETKLPVVQMEQIAFACPREGPPFASVFPEAPNPNFTISESDRPQYHALAVLSGNLPAFLWNETAREITSFSGLPPEQIMGVYLKSIVDRFIETPFSSLTGPVVRKDAKTVALNLEALAGKPKLKSLYTAFLDASWPEYAKRQED